MSDALLVLFVIAMLFGAGVNLARIVRRERRLRALRRAVAEAGKQ
jgi:hypothetical protein